MSRNFNSSHSNHLIIRQMERDVTSDEFLQKNIFVYSHSSPS